MNDCLQSSVDFYSLSLFSRLNYLLHSLPRQPRMFRRYTSVLNEKCYIPSPFSSFPSSSHCIASRMCYEEEIWLFYRIGCNWVGFVLLLFNSSYVFDRKTSHAVYSLRSFLYWYIMHWMVIYKTSYSICNIFFLLPG